MIDRGKVFQTAYILIFMRVHWGIQFKTTGKRQYESYDILCWRHWLSSWSIKTMLGPVSGDSNHQITMERSWGIVEAVSDLIHRFLSQGHLKYATQFNKFGPH